VYTTKRKNNNNSIYKNPFLYLQIQKRKEKIFTDGESTNLGLVESLTLSLP